MSTLARTLSKEVLGGGVAKIGPALLLPRGSMYSYMIYFGP